MLKVSSCDHTSFDVVVCLFAFSDNQLLLHFQWINFRIFSQEIGMFVMWSCWSFDCCGIRKGGKCQNFKSPLVQKYRPDLKIILHKYSLGYPVLRLFRFVRSIERHGLHAGGGVCFLHICEESAVVEWLALGISKLGVPGSIPSRGTTIMVECPWAMHIF